MNRLDLDAIENQLVHLRSVAALVGDQFGTDGNEDYTPNAADRAFFAMFDAADTQQRLIAYARHLECQLADEVEYINTQNEDAGKLLTQAQARISELETALEPFAQALTKWGTDNDANWRYSPGSPASDHYLSLEKFQTAARVLRKGE